MYATVRQCLYGAAVAMIGIVSVAPSGTGVAAASGPHRSGYQKVMVIVEENQVYREIIGSPDAPYLTGLSEEYGSATHMAANYPVGCPSLPAYLLMTSGGTAGICDDRGPRHHPIRAGNIFAQLDAAHRPWRNYAEDLPTPCARHNGANGVFLVRHTAVPYYTSESASCSVGQVELGTTSQGALHDDLADGQLPAYALVTPNACHDMHGASSCPGTHVADGDRWLSQWIPRILTGADYRAGRLVVIITWDEGSRTDNHIPTIVISPTSRHLVAPQPYDHCSTLRTAEDLLHLSPLGCAQSAVSMVAGLNL